MAQYTWNFDAPSGTFNQHTLSRDLLLASLEDVTFPEHAGDAGGYGRRQGESVTWTRVSNIAEPNSAVLSEIDRIPEDVYSITTRDAVVQELGRSVPFTSLTEDLSWYDVENSVQGKLRAQMALVLDTLGSVAFASFVLRSTPGIAPGLGSKALKVPSLCSRIRTRVGKSD